MDKNTSLKLQINIPLISARQCLWGPTHKSGRTMKQQHSLMRNASGLWGCPQPIRETDAKQLKQNLLVEQTRSGSVLITWKLFRKWLTFGCWQQNKGLYCKRERERVFSSLINSTAEQQSDKPNSCHCCFHLSSNSTFRGENRCLMKLSPMLLPSCWMPCLCFDCSSKKKIIISLRLQAKCVISLGSQIWSKPSEIPLSGVSLHGKKGERKWRKHICSP